MSDTRQIARRYFDAWTSGDLRIDGREAFLAAGARGGDRP